MTVRLCCRLSSGLLLWRGVVTRWAGGGRMHRSLTSGRGVSAASGLGVTMRSGGRTWRHFGGMAGRSR